MCSFQYCDLLGIQVNLNFKCGWGNFKRVCENEGLIISNERNIKRKHHVCALDSK